MDCASGHCDRIYDSRVHPYYFYATQIALALLVEYCLCVAAAKLTPAIPAADQQRTVPCA